MLVINSTKTVYFDVDETLILSEHEVDKYRYNFSEVEEINVDNVIFYIHNKHKQLMREFKVRGHTVVVWSAGGSEWAERVIRLTELDAYVDLVISKPDWYVDDKDCNNWMQGKRTYLPFGDYK